MNLWGTTRLEKAIHAHASVAKIQFVPADNTPYWIVWQADYGLLRLSLTADPSDRGFVPGLAIKWLINRNPSEIFLHLSP